MASLTVDNWALQEVALDWSNQYIPDVLLANANDVSGRGIDLHVTKGGEALDMSGMGVFLVWRHENGNQDLTEFEVVDEHAGHFVCHYPNGMMHEGRVLARIAIYVGEDCITGSRDFRIRVEPNPIDEDEAMADESLTLFRQAVIDMNNMVIPITEGEIDNITDGVEQTGLHRLSTTGLTYLWGKIKAKFASLVNGVVAVTQGGTGSSTAAGARTALDVAQSNGASGTLYSAEQAVADLSTIAGTTTVPSTQAGSLQGQIDTLRDSVARKSTAGNTAEALIYCDPPALNRVSTRVKDSNGNTYLLIATDSYIQLYNATTSSLVWRITP